MNRPEGPLELLGRIPHASNATFLAECEGVRLVYKPIRGERPLWDFPGVVLAEREVAAHVVSAALGFDVVPPTWLREGPHGPGMVQYWVDPVELDPAPVDLVPRGQEPDGFAAVVEGIDGQDRPVTLVHELSEPLRRMALFDVVVNNADRKGGHVLAADDTARQGIDHGIAFHHEPKLRTVLWGWAGQPVPEDDLARVEKLAQDPPAELEELIGVAEHRAFVERCRALVRTGVMPLPGGDWPAVPWPPF